MNTATSLLKVLLLTLFTVFNSSIAAFVGDQVIDEKTLVGDYKLVGEGEMSWLWFDLYQARLFTPTGHYQPGQWPLSLELTYKIGIKREKLIASTESEWQRQSIVYKTKWLSRLQSIWPDISPEDRLLLAVDKQGVSHFHFNGIYLGSIDDQQFSPAFTAIWLSENTLKPELRNQLTGLQ